MRTGLRIDVARPALCEHAFEFTEIGPGERLVHAQLVDGDVVKMHLQESPRLGEEPGVVRTLLTPFQAARIFAAKLLAVNLYSQEKATF